MKLKRLINNGFFGKILPVCGEFGYCAFEGFNVPAQQPSWNYRKEDEGGVILDMLWSWQYVQDNVFGNVKGVFCLGATHITEQTKRGKCTNVMQMMLPMQLMSLKVEL